MYMSMCFYFACATASAPLSWLLSWLLLCTLGYAGVSYLWPTFQLSTIPSVQKTPKAPAYLCRLLTHNFSVFLFCSSVLHLHPCRYCSFVPSPHPPLERWLMSCSLLIHKLGLSDNMVMAVFVLKSVVNFKTKKVGISHDLVHAAH